MKTSQIGSFLNVLILIISIFASSKGHTACVRNFLSVQSKTGFLALPLLVGIFPNNQLSPREKEVEKYVIQQSPPKTDTAVFYDSSQRQVAQAYLVGDLWFVSRHVIENLNQNQFQLPTKLQGLIPHNLYLLKSQIEPEARAVGARTAIPSAIAPEILDLVVFVPANLSQKDLISRLQQLSQNLDPMAMDFWASWQMHSFSQGECMTEIINFGHSIYIAAEPGRYVLGRTTLERSSPGSSGSIVWGSTRQKPLDWSPFGFVECQRVSPAGERLGSQVIGFDLVGDALPVPAQLKDILANQRPQKENCRSIGRRNIGGESFVGGGRYIEGENR